MRIVLEVESGEVTFNVHPAGSTGAAGRSGEPMNRSMPAGQAVDAGAAPSRAEGVRTGAAGQAMGMAAPSSRGMGASRPSGAQDAGPAPDLRQLANEKPQSPSKTPSRSAARSTRSVEGAPLDAGEAPSRRGKTSKSGKNGGKS